jgi:hypothetical protein
MKLFFVNIWKYIALILTGIVAGLVYAMKQIKPVQNVSATEFINQQSRDVRIGKIKQNGQNLSMDSLISSEPLSARQIRKQKRLQRRAQRNEEELQSETQKEEQEQKLL